MTDVDKGEEKGSLCHCWWVCRSVQPLWKPMRVILNKKEENQQQQQPKPHKIQPSWNYIEDKILCMTRTTNQSQFKNIHRDTKVSLQQSNFENGRKKKVYPWHWKEEHFLIGGSGTY